MAEGDQLSITMTLELQEYLRSLGVAVTKTKEAAREMTDASIEEEKRKNAEIKRLQDKQLSEILQILPKRKAAASMKFAETAAPGASARLQAAMQAQTLLKASESGSAYQKAYKRAMYAQLGISKAIVTAGGPEATPPRPGMFGIPGLNFPGTGSPMRALPWGIPGIMRAAIVGGPAVTLLVGTLLGLKDSLTLGFATTFKVLGGIFKVVGAIVKPIGDILGIALLPILYALLPFIRLMNLLFLPLRLAIMNVVKAATAGGKPPGVLDIGSIIIEALGGIVTTLFTGVISGIAVTIGGLTSGLITPDAKAGIQNIMDFFGSIASLAVSIVGIDNINKLIGFFIAIGGITIIAGVSAATLAITIAGIAMWFIQLFTFFGFTPIASGTIIGTTLAGTATWFTTLYAGVAGAFAGISLVGAASVVVGIIAILGLAKWLIDFWNEYQSKKADFEKAYGPVGPRPNYGPGAIGTRTDMNWITDVNGTRISVPAGGAIPQTPSGGWPTSYGNVGTSIGTAASSTELYTAAIQNNSVVIKQATTTLTNYTRYQKALADWQSGAYIAQKYGARYPFLSPESVMTGETGWTAGTPIGQEVLNDYLSKYPELIGHLDATGPRLDFFTEKISDTGLSIQLLQNPFMLLKAGSLAVANAMANAVLYCSEAVNQARAAAAQAQSARAGSGETGAPSLETPGGTLIGHNPDGSPIYAVHGTPSLAGGGLIERTGLAVVHKGETVSGGGDVIIHISGPFVDARDLESKMRGFMENYMRDQLVRRFS